MVKKSKAKFPAAKAGIAFIISVALGAITSGLIVGKEALLVTVVIGALTTAGVYVVPNKT